MKANLSIKCESLEIFSGKQLNISKPQNGKKVSRKEYRQIVEKKMKQSMKMEDVNKKNGNRNDIEIKISG